MQLPRENTACPIKAHVTAARQLPSPRGSCPRSESAALSEMQPSSSGCHCRRQDAAALARMQKFWPPPRSEHSPWRQPHALLITHGS
eukprot:8427643-Pyramimonas_sp.AAC.1